jgi:transcription antitermination factor NusG
MGKGGVGMTGEMNGAGAGGARWAAGRWYAVYAKAGAEFQAAANLKAQGFRVFYPHYLGTLRHGRRVIGVARPCLPRYLFVQPTEEQGRLALVSSTVGCVGLVPVGREAPEPVPGDVVVLLMARADPSGLMRLKREERAQFEAASRGYVGGGSLAAFIAVLAGLAHEERIRLWVQAFGERQAVAMPGGLGGRLKSPVLR